MYLETYKTAVKPMPGYKQWVQQNMTKPCPPGIRKMPGRPSDKKRKKEADEDEGRFLKRPKKHNSFSICGQPGHNKKKCKTPVVNQPKDKGGRPYSDDAWVKNQRNKKEARARAVQEALGASSSQEVQPSAPMPSQSTQATPSTKPTPTGHQQRQQVEGSARQKLPIKSKMKKKLVGLNP